MLTSLVVRRFSRPSLINTNVKEYFKDYVELRSDVKTLPTQKMRESVLFNEFGDDSFYEDPTVIRLESKLANIFGMEAALFCSSGTMANMVSINVHAKRGNFICLGDNSHLNVKEIEQIRFNGWSPITFKNLEDGTFQLDQEYLESRLVPVLQDKNNEVAAICLENSHNFCGGRILPVGFQEKLEQKITPIFERFGKRLPKFHLDGSRVLNSSVASGVAPKDIVKGYSTINFCLSKGIGAPCGSVVLMKSASDYDIARNARYLLGGQMRQMGFLAAPALVALEDYVERFTKDHSNAKLCDKLIKEGSTKIFTKFPTETNILNLYCDPSKSHLLKQLTDKLRINHKVLLTAYSSYIRLVFHHQVSTDQTKHAAKSIITEANLLF